MQKKPNPDTYNVTFDPKQYNHQNGALAFETHKNGVFTKFDGMEIESAVNMFRSIRKPVPKTECAIIQQDLELHGNI